MELLIFLGICNRAATSIDLDTWMIVMKVRLEKNRWHDTGLVIQGS